MKSSIVQYFFILSLLSTNNNLTFSSFNTTLVCDVIQKINHAYQIDSIVIYRESSFEKDFRISSNFFKHLQLKIQLPFMHLVKYSNKQLRFVINRDFNLSIIFTRLGSFEGLNNAQASLDCMHISQILIVISRPISLTDLKYLLDWLSQEKFFEVIVLFEEKTTMQIQIFTIDPYPSVKWLNRTELLESGKFFLSRRNDLKQYRIETPFNEDVPRVFFYTARDGKRHLVGRNANIIMLFAKQMNITFVMNHQPNMDLKMILNQHRNKDFELSLHSYPTFLLRGFGWSYPLDMLKFCVIVPYNVGVPKSQYFFIAFDFGTWIAVGISVLFITVLMKFLKPFNTTNCFFFHSLALMLYSPNTPFRMIAPNTREFLFFGQVFLLAFILSCFYSTYLTSFCTKIVYLPPIETVDDISRANLRIMVIDYEQETARQYSNFGETFLRLLYPVPYFETIKRRSNFDHNFAYIIQHDRWFYLDKQQRGLEHPTFRISNICFGPHYIVFPLKENSHLQPYLFDFFLRVQQAGLDQYWEEEAFRLAVAMNHSKVLVDRTVFVQPLDLDYFQYVFAGWLVGLGISGVSFIDELFGRKRKSSKKSSRRK